MYSSSTVEYLFPLCSFLV